MDCAMVIVVACGHAVDSMPICLYV